MSLTKLGQQIIRSENMLTVVQNVKVYLLTVCAANPHEKILTWFYRKEIQCPKHHELDEQHHEDYSLDPNNNCRDVNNSSQYITMASEDLLQPGHVVKERWKVVSSLHRNDKSKGRSILSFLWTMHFLSLCT